MACFRALSFRALRRSLFCKTNTFFKFIYIFEFKNVQDEQPFKTPSARAPKRTATATSVAAVIEEAAPVQSKPVEKEAENLEFKAPARRVFKRGGKQAEKDEADKPQEQVPEPTKEQSSQGMFIPHYDRYFPQL